METTTGVIVNGMAVSTTKKDSSNVSETFYVESQTDPEREYLIVIRPSVSGDGYDYICTCPDYLVRRFAEYGSCKHIDSVKMLALLIGSPNSAAERLREL